MKQHKRLLSIAIAATMLLGVIPLTSTQASAAGIIFQMPPLVTFTVPETIWLDQGVMGNNLVNPANPQPVTLQPQTRIVAYSNITNTLGTQATGEVVFHADGATNLVITATQVGVPVTGFGTMSGTSGEDFTHTLANGAHLPTAVPANTAVIIEWTASYQLPNVAPDMFTSRAFSVAYAPNSNITGSMITVQHTVNGGGNSRNGGQNDGWGWLMAESGSAFFMAGLQTVQLTNIAGNNWTLDPQRNLSEAVLAANETSTHRTMEDMFDGNVFRGGAASRMFSLSYAQANARPGASHGAVPSNTTAVHGGRPSGVSTTGSVAYWALRNNVQATSQSQVNNLQNTYANGRWARHSISQHVGSMRVDTSRFTNLGQVPGIRFSAMFTEYTHQGSQGSGANEQWARPIANQNDGDFVRIGGYTRSLGTNLLPRGQSFSSHGQQINITPGNGLQNIAAEARHSVFVDIRAREHGGFFVGWQIIPIRLGNSLTAGFNFDLHRTDKTVLRNAALVQRHPDQFYVNNNVAFNNHLRTITNLLGNPLEGNTTFVPVAGVLEIGPGQRWEIYRPSFNLTVNNGIGGGAFYAGATGTITADAPPIHHHFVRWDGDYSMLANRYAATTTFTMPSNAANVTAVWAENQRFPLTVMNGTGSGQFFQGETGTISANAPPPNHHFAHWAGSFAILADRYAATTTFTMPGNAAVVTPVFVENPRFTLNVTNGTGTTGGPFFAGAQVTATAPDRNDDGSNFERWIAIGVTLMDETANPAIFNMPAGNVTLTAVYADDPTFILAVNNGTGGGSFLPAGRYPIAANSPAPGMRFAAWIGDITALDNPLSAATYVTISNANVSVAATFELIPLHALTVVGGTGSGTFEAGATVFVTANNPPAGQMFTGWMGNVDFNDADAATTTFTMPAGAITVTATFSDIPRHAVTVVNGNGGGEFMVGSTVTIIADAPQPGQVFAAWTGDIAFANATATTTTFVMPDHALSVTATFRPVDRDVLNALIAAIDARQPFNYTEESWATVQSALASARAVAALITATQPQINAVLEVLLAAQDRLVLRPPANFTALNTRIAQVTAMTQGSYTDASWATLQNVLRTAQAIAADSTATQAQVNGAVHALNAAVDALVEPPLPAIRTIFNTRWESNFFNWLLFFFGFGWVWMWF